MNNSIAIRAGWRRSFKVQPLEQSYPYIAQCEKNLSSAQVRETHISRMKRFLYV